jgi:putative Holliday junction resolvase
MVVMRILGIDYGKRKVGLAIGYIDSKLSEPYKVIRYSGEDELFKRLERIIDKKDIDRVVVGVSEGSMGRMSKKFGEKLQDKLNVEVLFQDETLTTREAQELAVKGNVKRKKRKEMEDAYSASLILQGYLESL